MLTHFQRRKLTRYFNCIDQDGKGFFVHDDVLDIARRMAQARNVSEGSDDFQLIADGVMIIWDNARIYSYNQDPNRVTQADWLIHESIVLATKEIRESYMEKVTRDVFDLADLGGKGYMTEQDYADLMTAFGVEPELSHWAFFQVKSKNKDTISRNEFIRIVEDFHISEDRSAPGNYLFGPY